MVFKNRDSQGGGSDGRRINILFMLVFFVASIVGCKNLEDVKPTSSDSFLHFFGGAADYTGVTVEQISDGYLVVGDSVTLKGYSIIVIKTDKQGNQLWRRRIVGGTASALLQVADGYLIVGDSIKVNTTAVQVNDINVKKSRLVKIDLQGAVKTDLSYGSLSTIATKRIDNYANSLSMNNDTIIIVSSVKLPTQPITALVTALKLNGSVADTAWSASYIASNRDFVNSSSVHLTADGHIAWVATWGTQSAASFKGSIELSYVKGNGGPDNGSQFGQNDSQSYAGNDIQPNAVGYGIAGTYQDIQGANKNICFVRADPSGTIIPNSDVYFDGGAMIKDRTSSSSDDEGTAIATVADGGFVIGGYTTTTSKDAILIRVDPQGNLLWFKTFGGAGDETVSSVKQTSDGGFVVSGTSDLAGLSSIFILKVDANGSLQN